MAKLSRDDAYYLGLIYTNVYLKAKIALKTDLESFYEKVNSNFKEDEQESNLIDNEDQSYFYYTEEEKDVVLCYLKDNFVYRIAINEFVSKLPIKVIVASQSDESLKTLGIEKSNVKKNNIDNDSKEEASKEEGRTYKKSLFKKKRN